MRHRVGCVEKLPGAECEGKLKVVNDVENSRADAGKVCPAA